MNWRSLKITVQVLQLLQILNVSSVAAEFGYQQIEKLSNSIRSLEIHNLLTSITSLQQYPCFITLKIEVHQTTDMLAEQKMEAFSQRNRLGPHR